MIVFAACLSRLPFTKLHIRLSANTHKYGLPGQQCWYAFGLLNSQFFILRRTVQIAPHFLHCNVHIFLFGLILRDIPNSITPQTTLRLLPIPVGLLVLTIPASAGGPLLLPSPLLFLTRTEEPAKACATTALQCFQLLYITSLWENTAIWVVLYHMSDTI